jgi:hypothetical protein
MDAKRLRQAYIVLAATLSCAAASAQDFATEDTPSSRESRETTDQKAVLESCATVPDAIDISVLDDRHVYIRTRGSNHYLLTTEQCDDLHTSYIRHGVELVPYGRRVCQNDGSYFRYMDSGRVRACNIERVQRVANRTAARELADGPSSAVTVEPVEIEPERDPSEEDAVGSPR